nr:retrovirus-related Pol polyprotein from transposon TNT 1-94 [Tanacetum cinerariifolium]
MNYLEEQTDEELMINCIKHGDQPLPRVTQVSIAETSSSEQPPLKDKSMETVGLTVVQKSGIQCYNCKEFGHVARECQKPKRVKDAAYHREKMLLCKQEEARIQLNTEEEIDQKDDDNDLAKERELLASLIEKLKCEINESKNRNKFLETSNKTLIEKLKGEIEDFKHKNKSLESSNNFFKEANNRLSETNKLIEEIGQNDDDNDLAKERELLASLIEKLKCDIDESKNCNKFLETSNKALIEKLKGEIEDFKTKNNSLESSNNFFKEANNKLSETNNLLYADYKKSEAELARRNSMEYASQMELECEKVRGNLLSYKMDYQKLCTKYTDTINALNQTISEMKDKLSAHQEIISILSQ